MAAVVEYHESMPPHVKSFVDDAFTKHTKQFTDSPLENFCYVMPGEHDVIGVIAGYSHQNGLHIKQLMVHEDYRRQNHGASLMKKAFDLAKERNCKEIWVDTLSYQGPDFYPKFGFEERGRIPGYHGSFDRIFYCCEL